MKKALITGATGFIGGALAKRLLLSGDRVFGVGRNVAKLNELKQFGDFHPVQAEFSDYINLDKKINECDFDAVYNFAWQGTSSAHGDYENYEVQLTNVKVAADLATVLPKLCSENACALNIGSYSKENVLVNSKTKFNPNIYGITKGVASELFMAILYKNHISCNALALPNVYGPNDKTNTAIVFFIKKLLANEPLNLIPSDTVDDWLYIDDAVDGIIAASTSKKAFTEYYVGHREITTFEQKLTAMKEALNSKSELNFGKFQRTIQVNYQAFDLDALYNDTGFEAKTDFKESIVKTAEWIATLTE
ncbi:MAG: NAD(P)-dependent oxidoreductase [Bifidobacteriaceae bacterium]|jgi:nucleoside-diphosphate-sugar epimerase|nr:NAD(P)-dependent oxidoreductase [Bifidobacteriaceae bacterium]